jgi:F-type H+-transporting ATPase subunit delta
MSVIRIASRYAKSLIGLAIEQGNLDKVYEDVQTIYDTATHSPDLLAMLRSPLVTAETKNSILTSVFKDSTLLTQLFLKKVISARRESYLVEIANQFIAIYNDQKGIARATVTAATPLDESSLNQIKTYISKKINKPHVQLTVKTDAEIIGGLVINYEDKLLDMSIKNELNKLKQQLN